LITRPKIRPTGIAGISRTDTLRISGEMTPKLAYMGIFVRLRRKKKAAAVPRCSRRSNLNDRRKIFSGIPPVVEIKLDIPDKVPQKKLLGQTLGDLKDMIFSEPVFFLK
tara:strand:+ start:120 stop:446 length:327 start_codon:yes stop_codon:yes gene_type:complete